MANKSTVLILLMIFLLNGAGFFKVYQFMNGKDQNVHREATKLQREDLLSVATTTGEEGLKEKGFKRLEENEYEYQSHRYDVVRVEEKGDQIIFYLKYDSYEEKLLTFITSFFSHSSNNNDANTLAKLVEIHKQYVLADYRIPSVNFIISYLFERHIMHFPSKPYLEIALPPPRIA